MISSFCHLTARAETCPRDGCSQARLPNSKMVRSSLGRAVLADSGGLEEEYPYYGISVPDFLALTEWLRTRRSRRAAR